MSKLKDLLANINEAKAVSLIDPADIDPRARSGFEGRINAAKRDIEKYTQEYRDESVREAVIMAVMGEDQDKIVEAAAAANAVVIDFNGFNKKLINQILSRKLGDSFDTNSEQALSMDLPSLGKQINIMDMPPPISHDRRQAFGVPVETAVNYILTQNYKTQLNSAYVRFQIGEEALKRGYNGKVPVVVYNFQPDYDPSLMPVPAVTVEATAGTTSDDVARAVNEFAKALGLTTEAPKKAKTNKKTVQVEGE